MDIVTKMKIIICAVMVFAVFVNGDENNDNWPCYMKKCSKSDPNLGKCLVNHANRALKGVLKGDPSIGIPIFNPYYIGSIDFGKGPNATYKLHMDRANMYGLEHLHVIDMKWDFENKTVVVIFQYNSAMTYSGDYSVTGTFKGKDVTGYGYLDIVYIGGSKGANITYQMNYELIKKLGRDHINIKSTTCTRSGEGFWSNFDNQIKAKDEVDELVEYVNKHDEDAYQSLVVEVSEHFCRLVNKAFNPVCYNFPEDLLFDK